MNMRYLRYIIVVLSLLACLPAMSQTDRREVRKGNREFRRGDWRSADISYRKALLKDSTSFAANYNLASNQYRQGNVEEAAAQMKKIAQAAPMSPDATDYYFNVGDYALAARDWNGAIDAFKQVLLRHPEDMEAKENLAYAQKMKQDEEQDQDNQDQDQDNENQDNGDSRDNQDQDNQDQDQNQDDQNQDRNRDDRRQDQDMKISPQQAQQMLQAIQAREKETQEKVRKAEAEAVKSRQKEKNW